MIQTNYDKLKQAARDMKAREIRTCRHYLSVAKRMKLTPNSPTIRYWTHTLIEWQELPIYLAMQYSSVIAASGLTTSEVEEVLENL